MNMIFVWFGTIIFVKLGLIAIAWFIWLIKEGWMPPIVGFPLVLVTLAITIALCGGLQRLFYFT